MIEINDDSLLMYFPCVNSHNSTSKWLLWYHRMRWRIYSL